MLSPIALPVSVPALVKAAFKTFNWTCASEVKVPINCNSELFTEPSANFKASIPVANLALVTFKFKIFPVVTASFAMVTAPVLASVTSPLTATEAISVPSPTKILPSPLAS